MSLQSHLRRDSVITKSLKEGKVSLQSHLRRDSVITKSLKEGQCHYSHLMREKCHYKVT